MITKFGINRFKSIEHFDERLTPLNVFVGTNNSGKSSVLQALHFAVSVAQSRRLLPDQQAAKESFSLATQQLLYTPLQDVMYLGRGGVLAQSPNKEIQVQIKLDTNDQGQIGIRRGKNKNIAITAKGAEIVALLEDLSRPFSVYVPGLAGIAKTESFVSMGMLLRSVARGDANLVLRNVLYTLHQNGAKWATFSSALDKVFSGVTIEISFDPNQDEFIEAWVVKNGERLPLDGAGTGLLQTAQILSYIYLFEPTTTLLDEPDSHLHPSNQRSLSELLIDLSNAGSGLIGRDGM